MTPKLRASLWIFDKMSRLGERPMSLVVGREGVSVITSDVDSLGMKAYSDIEYFQPNKKRGTGRTGGTTL